MKTFAAASLGCLTVMLTAVPSGLAQSNSGTLHGTVLDPSSAVIGGAVVTIQNPVSHYSRSTTTDGQGKFELSNIPFNNYHLTANAAGFQVGMQDIDVRSTVPLALKISLTLGKETQSVIVEAGADLLENDSAGWLVNRFSIALHA